MSAQGFSIAARFRSFRFALNGIRQMIRHEHNAWIHALATVGVIAAGFTVHLSREEWMALVIVISLVWITEAINTCFEKLLDLLHPAQDARVGILKDMAAGAVLLAALAAVITGLLIFIPHFLP